MKELKRQIKIAEKQLATLEPGSPEWVEVLARIKELQSMTQTGTITADGKLAAGATIGVALIPVVAKRFGFIAGDASKYLPKLKWK